MEQLFDSTKRWRSFVRFRWHSCPLIRLSWSIEGRHFIFRANYWRRFREKMIWIEKSFWQGGHSFFGHYDKLPLYALYFTKHNYPKVRNNFRPEANFHGTMDNFCSCSKCQVYRTSEIFMRNCYTLRTYITPPSVYWEDGHGSCKDATEDVRILSLTFLTFFHWTFWAAFPSFLDRVIAAEFRTLDQRTADFAIIALAFGSARAWGPALTMLV